MYKKIKFVRFGGLSSVKQKHYISDNSEKGFHNPPRKKGIYAFPQNYIEKFLLGATNHPALKYPKAVWLKDENGNLLKYYNEFHYNENTQKEIPSEKLKHLLKRKHIKMSLLDNKSKSVEDDGNKDYFITVLVKPKIFSYDGDIWHHFIDVAKPQEILNRSGSWILSSYKDYCKLFERERHFDLRNMHSEIKHVFNNRDKIDFNLFSNNVYKHSSILKTSMDHLEVFIEKI